MEVGEQAIDNAETVARRDVEIRFVAAGSDTAALVRGGFERAEAGPMASTRPPRARALRIASTVASGIA